LTKQRISVIIDCRDLLVREYCMSSYSKYHKEFYEKHKAELNKKTAEYHRKAKRKKQEQKQERGGN